MSLVKKIVLWAVFAVVLAGGYLLQDWYRFTKYSAIDPERGVYGSDHLEVWIQINKSLPSPMRKWACKTLLDRETAILGGTGRPPYGCDADFDPNAVAPAMSKALIDGTVQSVTAMAAAQGATKEQVATLKTCMETEFAAKITPEQIEGMNAPTIDNDALIALSQLGQAVMPGCKAAAGIN